MTATTTALYPDVVSTAIRVRTHTAEDRDQAVLTEMTLDFDYTITVWPWS